MGKVSGGNSHQRKVFDKAVELALQRKQAGGLPVDSANIPDAQPKKVRTLDRPSIEAYVFFILGAVGGVLNCFGIPINFWAGAILSLAVGFCAVDLLWRSLWTFNWNRWSKIGGTVIVLAATLLIINQGYLLTHRPANNENQTSSAVATLIGAIGDLEVLLRQPVVNDDPFESYGENPAERGQLLTHLEAVVNGWKLQKYKAKYKAVVVAYHLFRGDILDATDLQKSEPSAIEDEPLVFVIPLTDTYLDTLRHGAMHTNYTLIVVPNGMGMQWKTMREAHDSGAILVSTHSGPP